jgi:hypothetical protein
MQKLSERFARRATERRVLFSRGAPVEPQTMRLEITLPSHIRLSTDDRGEISPDGRHIVLMAAVQGRPELIIRDLDSMRVIERDDTEGASYPFWSPDSQSIGFFADGKLKRIALSGGPPIVLEEATSLLASAAAPPGRAASFCSRRVTEPSSR